MNRPENSLNSKLIWIYEGGAQQNEVRKMRCHASPLLWVSIALCRYYKKVLHYIHILARWVRWMFATAG